MIEILKQAAYEAGNAILEVYHSDDFEVELKDGVFPLTRADKAAHLIIEQHLKQTGLPVLSEEGREIPYTERSKWDRFWMVDPLDGTKEFLKRNGEFTVNIALIEDQKPVLGVVYTPVLDRMYIGGKDVAPQRWVDGVHTQLQLQHDRNLDRMKAMLAPRVVASRSHLNDDTRAFLEELNEPTIVSMGSSLKFMALADNDADIYPRFAPTMEWDTAAAHAIMNSLGMGVYLPNTTTELLYNKEDLLNPYFICY